MLRRAMPWTLLGLLLGFLLWLAVALAVTENARNALFTQACAAPILGGPALTTCLAKTATRAHWWQHVGYAMGHLRP